MSPIGAAIKPLSTGLCQGCRKAQAFDCRINRLCRHVAAGISLQIATGRFREAAESTAVNHTAGRNREIAERRCRRHFDLFTVGRMHVHETSVSAAQSTVPKFQSRVMALVRISFKGEASARDHAGEARVERVSLIPSDFV
jgi:hypothetical protein